MNFLKRFQKDHSKYKVEFNREAAWTLKYEDEEGVAILVFEPGANEKWIRLDKEILIENKVIDRKEKRSKLAFARTKEYLQTCGYTIEDDDEKT